MTKRRLGRLSRVLAGLPPAALVAGGYLRYRHDLQQARERVLSGGSIIETASGPIEYAVAGEGPPILVVHGAGGGYDQGLDLVAPLVRRGLRAIAMSRFGYQRTPLPADASPAAQADAHASLLDALHIPRVAVVGISAGAPSAMQFALRFPERTAALVLLVPAAYAGPVAQPRERATSDRTSPGMQFILNSLLQSDFLFWVACGVARQTMIALILGTPAAATAGAGAEERAQVTAVLAHILPLSMRRRGLLNDANVVQSLPRYDLERIAAPTLTVSAADDLYGTYEGARYSAEHIPHARFLGYPSGGHLLVGHEDEVMAEIATLVRSSVASEVV